MATCILNPGRLKVVVNWENIRTILPTKTSSATQKAAAILSSIDVSTQQSVASDCHRANEN